MSGGHFDYQQYRLKDIANEIESLIDSNEDSSLDYWGNKNGSFYSEETISKFKEAVNYLRKAEIMAQRIDWLVSGDDSEETFHERWEEELSQLKENI